MSSHQSRHSTPGHKNRRSKLPNPQRRIMFSLVGLLLTSGIVLGAIQLGRVMSTTTQPTAPQGSSHSAVPGAQSPTPATSLPISTEPDSKLLATEFVQLEDTLNATVGIAIAPAGRPDAEPIFLGPWRSGPAWSTIKVPLTIAGYRAGEPPAITDAMSAAITQSDNDAAESVWESLGPPATAATKVQAVLAATGDPTLVQSEKIRPQFSAFGQTEWSLSNQLRFLSAAVCDGSNDAVFNLMAQIGADQSWGLGRISGARYKGGWGPSPDGAYLVRQIGVIPTDRGLVVVAAAAEPQSGSFADGIADLTRIAIWLQAHTDALPAGTCPASDPEGHS